MNNFSDLFGIPEELDNTIILTDEDGNDICFEFVDLIEYGGDEYVVLIPAEESDEASEVVILLVEKVSDEEETYVSIDDEAKLNKIFDLFKERYKDMFDFVDE